MTDRGADGRTLAPFGRRRALVVSTRTVGAYVLLELADRGGPDADPGQFHMLATVNGWGADGIPFLPRAAFPMGSNAGNLWFMLEDVGPGTHRLSTLKKGEPLWVLGPLGRGFRADPERRAILVSDGIGLPPIMAFVRTLAGAAPTLLLGFPSALHAQVAASFAGAQLATDDGSVGHHGSVVTLLEQELDRDPHATVYAAGPPATLGAIRALTVARGVPAQLALQGPMACGFGACQGCAVPLAAGGHALVCVDGPVMAAEALA